MPPIWCFQYLPIPRKTHWHSIGFWRIFSIKWYCFSKSNKGNIICKFRSAAKIFMAYNFSNFSFYHSRGTLSSTSFTIRIFSNHMFTKYNFTVSSKKNFLTKVPILQVMYSSIKKSMYKCIVLLFRMQLWPVAHFFHSLLGGFAVALLLHPPKSEWKKWATGQSCIRKRSTTWKIGTLALISMKPKFEHYLFTTKFFRKLWNHIWIWNPCIIKS